MAKKNLSALMHSIMGERTENMDRPVAERYQDDSVNVQSPPSGVSETSIRRPKGRPRTVSNETVATFKIDKELLMKLKYISLMENSMQKEILHYALSQYIADWEREHGIIPLP